MFHENSGCFSNSIPCKHETKNLFETNSNCICCFNCSSIIYCNKSGKLILPVKPPKFNAVQEIETPI